MVLIYYFFILAPGFVLFNSLLYHNTIPYLSIIEGILYEVIFSILFPFTALLILPERYKQPMW